MRKKTWTARPRLSDGHHPSPSNTKTTQCENSKRDTFNPLKNQDFTRSMSQIPDTTENAAERPEDSAEVERLISLFGGPFAKIVARPKSRDKYYDLDESILAMGIFIDTVKEEHLKDDPCFAFTTEFYRATMHDFNSLSDDNKAIYIAEAKKRNTLEDGALGAKWVSKEETIMYQLENDELEAKAVDLYHDAVEAEHRKNSSKTGKSDGPLRKSYFRDLKTAEDKRPYLAEATVRQLEEHAEVVNCSSEDTCDCESVNCNYFL